jgi:flagellar basal body-associated protein FliL
MEGMVVVLIPLAAFAMVVLIVWIGHQSSRHSIHEKAELRRQLLSKFGSAQELTEFLATPHGKSFLIEKDRDAASGGERNRQRIIALLITGLVLAILGIGLLGLMYYQEGFVYPGVLVLALGIGFLASAGVSFRLYKNWGLFS